MKKRMKRLISCITAVMVIVSFSCFGYAETESSETYNYEGYSLNFDKDSGEITRCTLSKSLEEIILPETIGEVEVISIGDKAFKECYGLKHITIPCCITAIGKDAFTDCSELTIHGDADSYAKDYAEENNIPFVPLERMMAGESKFPYYSRITSGTEYYGYEFDDAWFTGSSSGYDVDRARISMRLALAAGRTTNVSIKAFYSQLGLQNPVLSFATPAFDYEKGESTIGYAIGTRKIKDENGEDCNLVVVAIRSAGYKAEWGDNFTIGTGAEHKGFRKSADKVTEAVETYIDKQGLENAKIWVTGFSRGAAVGNICAHQFNEWAESEGHAYLDSTDDVFAYCFECPRNVRSSSPEKLEEESNIINVVNSADLVTKIAPQAWGFERYGRDYYIPARAYTAEFPAYMEAQTDIYYDIAKNTTAAKAFSDEEIWAKAKELSTLAEDQASTTREVADAWADCFESPDVYCQQYEATMAGIASMWQGTASKTEDLIKAIPGFAELHPGIYEKLLAEGTSIYQTHLPEYTLSWIDSIDSVSDFVSPKYRKLMIDGPVDISIRDESGNRADIETYTDEKGNMIAILPFDGEYIAELAAGEDGKITYQVQEWNDAAAEAERTVIYDGISFKEGEMLTGSIEKISSTEKAEYVLKDEEGNSKRPTRDYAGDKDREYAIEVVTGGDGEGDVTGSGTYLNGEYVKLDAQSAHDSFQGWYLDGDKISDDSEYWLRVTKDATITGKFKAHGHETGDRKITKATLKKDGKIASAKCSICGKIIPEIVIPRVKSVKLSSTSYAYSGKVKKPSVTVKDSRGKTLKKDTDYTVRYASGRKDAGKYKVTVEGAGNYSFTKTLYFKINPKGTYITSLKSGRKCFTVKWKKQTAKMSRKHITGYQIKYSTSSSMKNYKTVTKKNYAKTGRKVRYLKADRKYYVKIRTYMEIDKVRYYSKWSKVKTVRTK